MGIRLLNETHLKTHPKKKLGHCELNQRSPLLNPKICPLLSTVRYILCWKMSKEKNSNMFVAWLPQAVGDTRAYFWQARINRGLIQLGRDALLDIGVAFWISGRGEWKIYLPVVSSMRKEEEDRIELKRRVIMMIDDLERMLVVEMAFEKDEGRSRNRVSPIATAPPLKIMGNPKVVSLKKVYFKSRGQWGLKDNAVDIA